jgi:hypothetical protein
MNQKERRIACKSTGESGFHGILLRRKKQWKKQ